MRAAPRVDFADKALNGDAALARKVPQRVPERRFQRDAGGMARDGDGALDAIRDAAAMTRSPLRLLRPATRSLEDLYVDAVGADADGGRSHRRASKR